MRPVPPHSTDLIYSTAFKREDLQEVAEALGHSDLKIVSTTTLEAERVLYHACLNGIQTYVKLHSPDETTRAKEIAELADAMYAALLPDYRQAVKQAQPRLIEKTAEATEFCQHLQQIEGKRQWNKTRYQNTWNTNDYPPRWQKKAIETYGIIRERMDKGEYMPPEGKDAGSLTTYWSLRNLEYKHYRDLARARVESHISAQFPPEKLLTMHPAAERTMTMFIGGMGSGKSALTNHYIDSLPEQERTDVVLHNADYLKYALFRRAAKEGRLPQGHVYNGAEVQAESSNALYEGTRKRSYLARQKFCSPNVVLNSIVFGYFEAQEGIASGGSIVAHHVHIPVEDAIAESEKRRASIGRAPSAEDIRWSAKASARSLLMITQPEYKGTNITMHLYAREAGKAPRHYATIDAQHSRVQIYDMQELEKLAHTAELTPEALLKQFMDAGFTVQQLKSHAQQASRGGAIYAAR